jgi:hypothetical protein
MDKPGTLTEGDILALTSLNQLIFILRMLVTFVTKLATIIRQRERTKMSYNIDTWNRRRRRRY